MLTLSTAGRAGRAGRAGDGDPRSSTSLSDLRVAWTWRIDYACLEREAFEGLGGVQPVGISGREISCLLTGDKDADSPAPSCLDVSVSSLARLRGDASAKLTFEAGEALRRIAIPARMVAAILAWRSIIEQSS